MSKWTLIIEQESEYGYGWKSFEYESESITPLVHIIDTLKASDVNPVRKTKYRIDEVLEEEVEDDDVDE